MQALDENLKLQVSDQPRTQVGVSVGSITIWNQ